MARLATYFYYHIGDHQIRKSKLHLSRVPRIRFWPKDGQAMLRAIKSVKAEGINDAARETLRDASAEFADRGAGHQLVASSEFSLIAHSVEQGAGCADGATDTVDVLVGAIKEFSFSNNPPEPQ